MDDTTAKQRFAEAAREKCPDLGLLCLLVGAAADPPLTTAGLAAGLRELDRLAGLVKRPPGTEPTEPARTDPEPGPLGAEPVGHRPATPDAVEPHCWAEALTDVLGRDSGFCGTPTDYQRLDSSLLHAVLRRRRGLPILLSVVWIEVGRRVGAPVYGVALPGHFIVGIGDPAGQHVLADSFRGGRLLAEEDVELLVTGATGTTSSPAMLAPADPLDVMLRVLNNIRMWASARPEHTAVQLWAVELSLLLPRHPARLRYEHARLLVQRGDFAVGAAEMESYAEVIAPLDPTAAESLHRQAHSARALLN